jgi:hypothetical protein
MKRNGNKITAAMLSFVRKALLYYHREEIETLREVSIA